MTITPPPRDRSEDRRLHGDFPQSVQIRVRAKNVVRRLITTGQPVARPDHPYLVVPILGQSNAQGNGLPIDPAGLDAPDPSVHQWAAYGRHRGRIVLATEPLMHHVPGKGVGFGLTFGKRLAADTGRPVLLVPCARGDTSFFPKNGFSWDPANTSARVNLFDNAVTQIDRAVAAAGVGAEIAAILWHQGESDAPLLAADEYLVMLDELITRLRTRYGSVPFVMGQMVAEEMASGHPDYPNIDAVHRDTPNRHERVAFVPGPAGMFNSEADKHYSAQGQRELGARLYGAYRRIL